MAAAMNGIALHGGLRPYGGTFLAFADYCRPAIRLSALMGLPVTYVMTHDSIGLGEDGPTHQPVEQLASLRAIPNLTVLRPADAVETAEAWEVAMSATRTPTVLCLSRQNLPTVRTVDSDANLTARGAYVLREPEGAARRDPGRHRLRGRAGARGRRAPRRRSGSPAAVVSAPSFELFARAGPRTTAPSVLGSAPLRRGRGGGRARAGRR